VIDERALYALVGDKWLCRGCFFKKEGRSWPRPAPGWMTRKGTTSRVETSALPRQVPTICAPDDALFHRAVNLGLRRMMSSISKGYKNTAGAKRNVTTEMMSALAEAYAAQALKVEWSATLDDNVSPDIGTQTEVKHIAREGDHLLLRPKRGTKALDPLRLDRPHVVVYAAIPPEWADLVEPPADRKLVKPAPIQMRLLGWRYGREVATDANLRPGDPGRPPCWMAASLRPMSEIPKGGW
jgi:hypothetical protein